MDYWPDKENLLAIFIKANNRVKFEQDNFDVDPWHFTFYNN